MLPLPDSPRWLLSRSKLAEATRALQRLRIAAEVSPEIAGIKKSMTQQSGTWAEELFQPAIKMPLIVGLSLAVFQQITGINTVMYYSPTIFKFAGINGTGPAILAGASLATVMWCVHVVAIFLLDRVGRRPLLLVRIGGQVVGLAILGAGFQFSQVASFKSAISIGGLVIYVASFAIGLGPVFWLLISEIFPLKVRGAAMSAVTVTNWGMNMAVAATFLTMVNRIGHAGTFWAYGLIAVAAWFFCYRLVPETKGKTLEQIEAHWRSGKPPRT
jgi:sugar porter (SP) family MFS transporter